MVNSCGRRLAFFVVGCGLVAAPHAASAQPGSRHVKASLVAERDAVQPGRPLSVGVRLDMEAGWHTYWRNPGDSGLPTRVKWTLPAGFEAGEVGWPAPRRFAEGSTVSYGYDNQVLLPVSIKAPRSIEGTEVRLAARVEWLECHQMCVAGKADVALTLPVRAYGAPTAEAAALETARLRLPAVDRSWRFTAVPGDGQITLGIVPKGKASIEDAYLFTLTPRVVDYNKPQKLDRAKEGYLLNLPLEPGGPLPGRLSGVLVVKTAGSERALEVDVVLGRSSGK